MTSPNQIVQDFIGAQRAATLSRRRETVAPESPLPEAEQKRLRYLSDHDPEARTWERIMAGKTTDPLADGNPIAPREPAGPDEVERGTGGRYRLPREDEAEPGYLVEVATGRLLSMEVVKARQLLALAES